MKKNKTSADFKAFVAYSAVQVLFEEFSELASKAENKTAAQIRQRLANKVDNELLAFLKKHAEHMLETKFSNLINPEDPHKKIQESLDEKQIKNYVSTTYSEIFEDLVNDLL